MYPRHISSGCIMEATTVVGNADGQQQQRRVAMLPCPFQGHINPMLQLASLLHSRGFTITILHTDPNVNTADHPHFHFVPVPVRELTGSDVIARLLSLNAEVERQLEAVLEGLPEVVCLVTDAIMWSAKTATDKLRLPRIVLRTGSAASFNVFALFPKLYDKGYYPIQDRSSDDLVKVGTAAASHYRIKDLPYFHTSSPTDVYTAVTNLVDNTKTAKAAVWNTFEAFESEECSELRRQHLPAQVPFFPVGPLHLFSPDTHSSRWTQDTTCLDWLDRQPNASVLYVSFGSLAGMTEDNIMEMARGLTGSGQRFLWVLRHGGSVKELKKVIKDDDDDRAKVVEWAPQEEVLRHPAVGGFWTHCGWNSTLEGVCAGVPMLCWPYFSDQMVNSRYLCCVVGVGVALEGDLKITREEVERGVRRVMVEEEGKVMRKRALELREEARRAVAVGGTSMGHLSDLVDFLSSI